MSLISDVETVRDYLDNTGIFDELGHAMDRILIEVGEPDYRQKYGFLAILALNQIMDERERQVKMEGHTSDNDQGYVNGELAQAAAALALGSTLGHGAGGALWPKGWAKFKGHPRRKALIQSGALIVAEIERLIVLQGQ